MGYIFVASLQQKGRLTTLHKVMIHVTVGKQASLLPYLNAAAYLLVAKLNSLVWKTLVQPQGICVSMRVHVFVARQGRPSLPYVLDKNLSYLIDSTSHIVAHQE